MKNEFAEKLNHWYKADHRDLPFRRLRDPYAIWVSEIMAQQTRIESMLPYYERWMREWPTIEDLAKPEIEDVLHLWQGLGYYNRARKLHEGAQYLVEHHHGVMPKTKEELLNIAGIGAYTAGAIMSICYDEKVPAVDGNVLRVMTRHDCMEEDITKQKTVTQVQERVVELMEEPRIFTQALMELGARVCTPKKPSCLLCPISDTCLAYQTANPEEYPHKKPKKKPLDIELFTYIIVHEGNVLISTDDSDGLMKTLRRLPQFETPLEIHAEYLTDAKHVFSHRVWKMKVYTLCQPIELEGCFWQPVDQLNDISMVTAHRKILNKFFGLQ